jgi:hypothetical protein
LYLVWRDTNDQISQNSTIYRIEPQYLSYLEGTPSGILGQKFIVKIKLDKPISKDIHKILFCNGTGNPNATVTTLNNRDDEISCEIVAQKNPLVNSGNQIFLKYSLDGIVYFVGKTFLYVITFGSNFFCLISKILKISILLPILGTQTEQMKFQSIMMEAQFQILLDTKSNCQSMEQSSHQIYKKLDHLLEDFFRLKR